MALGPESNHVIDGLTVNGALAVSNNAGKVAAVDYNRFASLARMSVAMNTLGYYHETFSKQGQANTSALATGILYATSIGLLAGDVVTNLIIEVNTAGATLTLFKVGLLDKAGNRLAVSADLQSGGNVTTGPKTIPMATPYTIPSDDLYYVAALSVGTTGPSLSRGLSKAISSVVGSASYGSIAFVSGQTDIQTTNTLVFTGATISLPLWVAVA